MNGGKLMSFVRDDSNYTCLKTTSLVVATAVLFGGIETLLVLTLRVCSFTSCGSNCGLIFSVFRYHIIRV